MTTQLQGIIEFNLTEFGDTDLSTQIAIDNLFANAEFMEVIKPFGFDHRHCPYEINYGPPPSDAPIIPSKAVIRINLTIIDLAIEWELENHLTITRKGSK